jgi:NarL family two-component system sensor histidine kinase LiaS
VRAGKVHAARDTIWFGLTLFLQIQSAGAMSWLLRPFRTLQWRLTLTYVLVTVLTVLTLEGILLAALDMLVVDAPQHQHSLVDQIRPNATESATYLAKSPPDISALDVELREIHDSRYILADEAGIISRTANTLVVMVLDNHGNVIASALADGAGPQVGDTSASAAAAVQSVRDLPQVHDVFAAALAGADRQSVLEKTLTAGTIAVIAVPIETNAHKVLGVLLTEVALTPPPRARFLNSSWFILLPSAFLLTLGAIFVGTIFGWLTARWLTRRLRVLTGAAHAWSQGDFTAVASDRSNDELGQLAQHLNSMAAEIEALLHERQDLAVVEERNRLARDLHDAVKQQVFATAMQLAAARSLLERSPGDVEAAATHVVEAEALTRQAQQELTALIRELRPVALADRGLVGALEAYLTDWARQTGIAASVRPQGEQTTPIEVEQALFRVAQEALANVARHSHAARVDVRVVWERDRLISLTIHDDGHGFDVDRADGKGTGLWSMRQRIAAVGGTLGIVSSSAAGTRIEVQVPLGPGPDRRLPFSSGVLTRATEPEEARESETRA